MRRTSRRDILPQRQQDILQTWWRKGPEDRIRVEVYPEGKLGDELSAIHQVSYGGIDFARVSLATVAENGSDAEVLMLPYLYSGREHMWKVLDGPIGTGMLSDFTDQGLVGLAWFDGGARSFYTVGSPVHEPEDLRGLRIRVQDSELMAELVTALGAEPVKAVYADVYKLLDLDQADGAENNLPSYAAENLIGWQTVTHWITQPGFRSFWRISKKPCGGWMRKTGK